MGGVNDVASVSDEVSKKKQIHKLKLKRLDVGLVGEVCTAVSRIYVLVIFIYFS